MFYGRQFSRWWDLVGGIRQDFRPGRRRRGRRLAFRVWPRTGSRSKPRRYVGASGRTHARFEVEYELLLTNRLVLAAARGGGIFGKSDPNAASAPASAPPTQVPSALRISTRVCAVCRCDVEQQVGEDRRLRRGRGRRHGRSPIRHRTAAVVLNLTTVEDTMINDFFDPSRPCRPGAGFRCAARSRMRATNIR